MRLSILAAALAAGLGALPANATVRISGDNGGMIGPYLQNLEGLRQSGERVIIDGACLSACTMVLGVIARDHICVTRRARLGFHAAWNFGQSGEQVTSREGTQVLMQHYPRQVRNWIARRGGLSPRMMYLSGGELFSMYASCQGPTGEEQLRASVSGTMGGAWPYFGPSPQAQASDWRQATSAVGTTSLRRRHRSTR
jgi:hypothetical protein